MHTHTSLPNRQNVTNVHKFSIFLFLKRKKLEYFPFSFSRHFSGCNSEILLSTYVHIGEIKKEVANRNIKS